MSATNNDDDNGDEEIPGREIAYRLFAAEYDDASFSYAESDEERAPNYVISPTGARLNRLFAVGTLTEVTSVNEEMVRARVVDPTGAFVVYAGQYQPDALATLEQLEPPAFVAVTGKARTFQPDDSDQVYTSIRPESIATVDGDTRDRWVVNAAEQTLDRVGTYAAAADLEATGDALTDALHEAGVESGLAAGIPLAQDHYGTTPSYLAALRDCAIEAVEVVAGDRDQVSGLSVQPGGSSPDYKSTTFESLADLAGVDLAGLESGGVSDIEAGAVTDSQPAEATAAAAGESDVETATDADSSTEAISAGSAAGTATSTDRDTVSDADSEMVSGADSGTSSESALETDVSESESESTSEPEPESEDAVTADVGDTGTDEPTTELDEPTATDDAAGAAEPEPADATEPEPAAAAEAETAEAESEDEELGDFDADEGGMYEMDDDEREQLEEEFGTEFTTGSEVEEPGEADIDVPEPEDEPEADASASAAESAADTDTASTEGAETGADDLGAPPESGLEAEAESEPEPESEPPADTESEPDEDAAEMAATDESETDEDEEPAEDIDLESYVVETMAELDDGDGADRTELVETVAADIGASEADVEDAIQSALMGGQCYEPNDETLKPI